MKQLFLITILAVAAWCTNYWIDVKCPDCAGGAGTSYRVTERDCEGSNGIKSYNHVSDLNTVVEAGDTVKIRGSSGSGYDTMLIHAFEEALEGFAITHSGTVGNYITYKPYESENILFLGIDNFSYGIRLASKSYIRITGYDGSTSTKHFKFENMARFLKMNDGNIDPPFGIGCNYNEISYCVFEKTNSAVTTLGIDGGSEIQHNCKFNWIHHNVFSKMGGYDSVYDMSSCLDLGWEDCGLGDGDTCHDSTHDNVIENNEIYHGGHQCILLLNFRNVVRNNILHNEQWYHYSVDDVWYGYRVIQMQGVKNADFHHGYCLIEGNRISHAANNPNSSLGGESIHLATSNNIVRYNDMYANGGNAINMENHEITDKGRICNNHIYNNTFFANGWESTYPNSVHPLLPPGNWMSSPPQREAIYFVTGSTDSVWTKSFYGNVIKNNITWRNVGDFCVSGREPPFFYDCPGYDVCGNTIFSKNFNDTSDQVDPKFTDEGDYGSPSIDSTDVEWYWPSTPDGSDITTVNNEPVFTLQSSSTAIDSGTYCTQADGAGSGTKIKVDDAGYFQPGWGNGAGGGAVVSADWIAIGTVSNTVQISSIDYTNDSITIASTKNWEDNASIWLYKRSDGSVVLYGSAPDAGAHERNNSKKYCRLYCTHK